MLPKKPFKGLMQQLTDFCVIMRNRYLPMTFVTLNRKREKGHTRYALVFLALIESSQRGHHSPKARQLIETIRTGPSMGTDASSLTTLDLPGI